MNAEFPLIDRYLDGAATDEDTASLVEAVEADPEFLAALCEAADIEGGLRRYLATPEQQRAMIPRIVPLWHWRRAGKWIVGAAAAAALAVSAAILFRMAAPGGSEKSGTKLASGMTVKRLTGDSRGSAAPAAAPPAYESAGPLEEAEFFVHQKWLSAMKRALPAAGVGGFPVMRSNLAGVFEIPVEGAGGQMCSFAATFNGMTASDRAHSDDFLVWYLRACGVTFPRGASARWIPRKEAFVTVNSSENVARITRIQRDPATMGVKSIVLNPQLWRIPAGATVPPLLQSEHILTAAAYYQLQDVASGPVSEVRKFSNLLMAQSESQCRFLLTGSIDTDFPGTSGPATRWERVRAHLQLNQWRVGDHVVISGLAGPRPDAEPQSSVPAVQNADLEFDLTLASGEAAVLHIGRSPDGTAWILVLNASIGNHNGNDLKPTFNLGSQPSAAMRFDQTVLTAKAGFPVRLLYKNDECPLLHNFVLVKPGTVDAVGRLSDLMLRNEPDAHAKLYIPDSPDILVTGTQLLGPGQSEEIIFNAPAEPGDYPYLCTFPGHWRLQQGILRVER